MKKREAFSGQENSTCKGIEAECIGEQASLTEAEQCGSGWEAGPSWAQQGLALKFQGFVTIKALNRH